jgi:hypothetical protein
MMAQGFSQKTYCTADAIASSGELNSNEDCSTKLNNDFIKTELDKCENKNNCTLDLSNPSAYITGYDAGSQCGSKAFIYIQAPCIMPDNHGDQRQVFGLITACIAVFIYLFTIVYFDYIKTLQKTKYVDFDVKTITAGDYTVEFDLGEEIYGEF